MKRRANIGGRKNAGPTRLNKRPVTASKSRLDTSDFNTNTSYAQTSHSGRTRHLSHQCSINEAADYRLRRQ